MKTITEILDDPRTEQKISESLAQWKNNKTWDWLRRHDMLAPTSIMYQYRRQQAQESALPAWVKTEIWAIVSEAISDVIDMERSELKRGKCKSLLQRLCNIVVTNSENAEKECNKDVTWSDCKEITEKLEHGFEETTLFGSKSEVIARGCMAKPCNNNVTSSDLEIVAKGVIGKVASKKLKSAKSSNNSVTSAQQQVVARLTAAEVLEKAKQGYYCPFNDDPCPYMTGEEETVGCGECEINILNNQK